jgi:hypothetical protein
MAGSLKRAQKNAFKNRFDGLADGGELVALSSDLDLNGI